MGISLIDFGSLDEVEIQALGESPLRRLLGVVCACGRGEVGDRPQWDAFICDER